MNDLRQAAQMALEALMQITTGIVRPEDDARLSVAVVAADDAQAAIDALRAALSAQTAPVAWQWRRKDEMWSLDQTFNSQVYATTADSEVRALYTHPAPTAQPLTDEQIGAIVIPGPVRANGEWACLLHLARAIERAHGIGAPNA